MGTTEDSSKVSKDRWQLESLPIFNTVLLKQQKQGCERDPWMWAISLRRRCPLLPKPTTSLLAGRNGAQRRACASQWQDLTRSQKVKEPRGAVHRSQLKPENASEGTMRIMNLMVESQLNPVLFWSYSQNATVYFTPCLRFRGSGSNSQCLLSLQRGEEETLNFMSALW